MPNDINKTKTVTISVTAPSRDGGQSIGRVTGPDSKWGIGLEWVGRKSGRTTTLVVAAPGIYATCEAKGRTRTFVAVFEHEVFGFVEHELTEEEVVEHVNGVEQLATFALRVMVADLRERIEAAKPKDQSELVSVAKSGSMGYDQLLAIGCPTSLTRGELIAHRERLIGLLTGPTTEPSRAEVLYRELAALGVTPEQAAAGVLAASGSAS
jgi:hypothetical protein